MNVHFTPLGLTATALENETVLDAARRSGAPIGNACGAVGVCGRCRVRVLSGSASLGRPTSIEQRVAQRLGFDADERLACQSVVNGDCDVTTSYW
jgi:ferredoxin